jgi:hypothetical protein
MALLYGDECDAGLVASLQQHTRLAHCTQFMVEDLYFKNRKLDSLLPLLHSKIAPR